MNAEESVSATNRDFVEYSSKEGGNYNPYNKAYFNNPEHMSVSEDTGRITSIPSPYARMHITDLAFQEYNCGSGVMTKTKKAVRKVSADYKRAMSHCLDIFELLFHSDEYDLKELGITLQKIELISTNSTKTDVHDILYDGDDNLNSLGRYIATLDLFRNEYKKVIADKNVASYSFDFSSLYILKYNSKTFASTSPFTGFSAKSDCDLDSANIIINERKILSKDPTTWRVLDERDLKFREFLYLLLKYTGLKDIFTNLFLSLDNTFESITKTKLDTIRFVDVPEYKKFNIGVHPLQKVAGTDDLFIRPDGLDCSYIKYLLYLKTPVELTIHPDDFTDLTERRFPSKTGQFTRWIGANDLLSDALYVLTYEINENYLIVPYQDKTVDGQMRRRCLLPIKRLALDFFTIDNLVDNMTIIRREENVYVVTLKVDLANGGHVVLRREYNVGDKKFPNGIIVNGEAMKPFAFGIYPFVKSNQNQNIYKVLFYNSFEEQYNITFYKRDDNGEIQKFLATECKCNKTNDINTNQEELPVNCEYHHLETKDGLEFAELSVEGKGTSLIVPKLRIVHDIPGTINVGIDLGTSNTYIAYTYQPIGDEDSGDVPDVEEICTNHKVEKNNKEWNELTFMNKKCEKKDDPNAPEKNREDLYLRTSDRQDAKPSDEWLDSQLCEFIPSRVDPNLENESYCFPIPTVINFLRKNAKRVEVVYNEELIPLLHCAIPFAYYERGTRQSQQKNYHDLIKDGSRFKWFYKKNEDGDFKTDKFAKACFKAFVSELLFIVRSHLVSKGYSLENTHILWSYPLSFSPQLVQDYIDTWNEGYKKIINPLVKDSDIENYVHYTNESRSPIFECLNNPATVDHLTLLADIGGGSTDIIGYKNKKPMFISSFGFAGNALYLDGGLNTVEPNAMNGTILKHFVSKQDIFNYEQGTSKTKKISKDDAISTLMNYGFAKDFNNFRKIFDNAGPKFMLLMHNAALIYHIAQLCRVKSPNEMPVSVFLTGNGSKLFVLNSGYKDMIRNIFQYVYESSENSAIIASAATDMQIINPKNPKAATVHGALKGYCKGQLATNASATADQVVMLGDASTVFDVKVGEGGAQVSFDGDYKEAIKVNIKTFIEMFYKIVYTTASPVLEKDKVIKAVDYVSGDSHLRISDNGVLSDSLFFQYVALVMQKLSFDLKDNYDNKSK